MNPNASLIVDPEIVVVDSHHHLWNRSHQRYLIEEFEADAASGTGYQHTPGPDHAWNGGCWASRGDITGLGRGQSMPKAGSFQGAPRAMPCR